MAKKLFVVRIVTHPTELETRFIGEHQPGHTLGEFMECMRYAGLIRIHRDNSEGMCFDIRPPSGVDSKMWAEMNAKRMQSFGYNAVCAPEAL